jgi:hypothetical protein
VLAVAIPAQINPHTNKALCVLALCIENNKNLNKLNRFKKNESPYEQCFVCFSMCVLYIHKTYTMRYHGLHIHTHTQHIHTIHTHAHRHTHNSYPSETERGWGEKERKHSAATRSDLQKLKDGGRKREKGHGVERRKNTHSRKLLYTSFIYLFLPAPRFFLWKCSVMKCLRRLLFHHPARHKFSKFS